VDKARRHGEALGIDLLAACARDATDAGDAAILHRNIRLARLTAGAVDHGAVAHDEVELSSHEREPAIAPSSSQGAGTARCSRTGCRCSHEAPISPRQLLPGV